MKISALCCALASLLAQGEYVDHTAVQFAIQLETKRTAKGTWVELRTEEDADELVEHIGVI
jgi:hypothetical protein